MADNIETRVSLLEQAIQRIDQTLVRIEERINRLETEMRSQFRWLLGIIIVVLLAQGALWLEVGHIGGRLDGISAQLGEITTLLRNQPLPKTGG